MRTTTSLPNRNNATNGRKAHNDNRYYKIGRVRRNSWATSILATYDLVIYESELVHIQNRHGRELRNIGITPFDFVRFICNNYNEVRKGSGTTLLLCVHRPHVSNMAAIEVHKECVEGRLVYKINTAAPIDTKQLCSKELLCANDH